MSAGDYLVGVAVVIAVAMVVTLPGLIRAPRRKCVRLIIEPRDLWIGVYRDTDKRRTYVCVVPCVALVFEPIDTGESEHE